MSILAVDKIYPIVWPTYTLLKVDNIPSALAKTLDIGGVDTTLFSPSDGHIIHIGERFRKNKVWTEGKHRDFTIRQNEWNRHVKAKESHGVIPAYYIYGYASKEEMDFIKLFVVMYCDWLSDVLEERTLHPFFKSRRKGNIKNYENFYYLPWKRMPMQYIDFEYPQEFIIAQPALF